MSYNGACWPTNPPGRVINFNAGPGPLPEQVLEKARDEALNIHGSGMSIMEISHRSSTFMKIITKAEKDLRTLMSIPDNYEVMFMQGGATAQFSAIPLNLYNYLTISSDESDIININEKTPSTDTTKSIRPKANYIVTGVWSQKAAEEASQYLDVSIIADTKSSNYTAIPSITIDTNNKDALYTYFCMNETVNGSDIGEDLSVFGYNDTDVSSKHILIADISSNIASKNINVSKFGVLIAGAQKNIGPAGVTIVIVRRDLIKMQYQHPLCPLIMSWGITAKNKSLYNTPPVHAIYICGLVFQWALDAGGIEGIEEHNAFKSNLLYEYLESTDGFYTLKVEKTIRSKMNVIFRIRNDDEKLEDKLVEEAKEHSIVGIAGHRMVGGLRVSLYNAVSLENVKKLIQVLDIFKQDNE